MAKRIPYSRGELFGGSPVRRFSGRHLDEIAFPLGGIGAGCVSLGGWGQLRDWEIFNHPNKGFNSAASFFALRCKQKKRRRSTVRLLQGQPGGSYVSSGHGVRAWNAKFPAFRRCEFEGEFPFARVRLRDSRSPVEVELEAFSPFIPLDDRNSSLPAAFFTFRLRNRSLNRVELRLLAMIENLVGYPELGGCRNAVETLPEGCGVRMGTRKHEPGSPRYGSMALVTPFPDTIGTARAVSSLAFDGAWEFWEAVTRKGEFPMVLDNADSDEKNTLTGGLILKTDLEPGAEIEMPVILAWHSPVSDAGGKPWKTYTGALFEDAWAVARYALANRDELMRRSRSFSQLLHGSTLPGPAVEAVSSQLSILKTPTCLRFEDGAFWGWEGCSDRSGCCPGSCSHVWNYAQALAWLFPALERSVREQHFALNMDPDSGRMCFRQSLPPGSPCNIAGFHPAADGQLGGILKVFREWKISGDNEWLRRVWPTCRRSLEFAWEYWDADRDGVIEGVQHNTYDNEFWGPNPMIGTFYLGALRAGAEMARFLGESERARDYDRLFESGRRWIEEHLFNGRWYRQIINPEAGRHSAHPSGHLHEGEQIPRYQFGEGCLSDQLIGEWYAAMLGLGPLLDPEHVRTALKSIFKHNWKPDLSDHACLLRAYALAKEAGLLLCTWPGVESPPYPFWFSSEVWCGIEYQVAAHMIWEGLQAQGMSIVKGVRDRHNGLRRNPYNEFECGHHYSRSLASYALLGAFAGFRYDGSRGHVRFAPQWRPEDFRCFFSVGSGWGVFVQTRKRGVAEVRIEIEEGELFVRCLALPGEAPDRPVEVRLGALELIVQVEADGGGTSLVFESGVTVAPGTPLCVRIGV
ncbi:MAG: hypothetical protein GXP31_03440 [Kiritimatiellaeota bacterium]|nr:hypothetical protein [Kiritimatiellota bacterium]